MGNKKINISDIESKLDFLNERIVKYRKHDVIRLFILIVMCAILFGVVACITFVCFKPHFSKLLSEKNDFKTDNLSSTNSESNIETETTTIPHDDTENIITKPIPVENLSESVVCIVSDADSDWLSNGSDNTFITCGLVINKNDSIYILTYYDKVAEKDEVLVYFTEDCGYKGYIKCLSENYKLALVEVDSSQISNEDLQKITPAIISPKRNFIIGESITYIGNPLGKKTLVTKGSLTLTGNTVSIMDAEMQIISTDIVQSGEINGFIFDKKGYIIGIVINDNEKPSDNIISFIDINSLLHYIENMAQGKEISYIGIYGKEVTDDVIKNIDSDMPYGIYISGIKDESPAYNAGIVGGDILVSINNKEIHNFRDYNEVLYNCNIGQEISITVMRKGKEGYKKIEYKVMVDGL